MSNIAAQSKETIGVTFRDGSMGTDVYQVNSDDADPRIHKSTDEHSHTVLVRRRIALGLPEPKKSSAPEK